MNWLVSYDNIYQNTNGLATEGMNHYKETEYAEIGLDISMMKQIIATFFSLSFIH
jgi:hypothetical protein